MDRSKLVKIILTALFAALIAVGAFIRIPLPPVPITLQTLFVLVAGLILPLPMALSALLVYLLLGIMGLPVFTSGGGIAALTGPTGGYLVGLVPAIIAEGLMLKLVKKESFSFYLLATFVANIFIYLCGLWWLGHSRGLDLGASLAAGLYPFIVGDIIKMVASALVAVKVGGQVIEVVERKED